ncbi:Do family serine endopeptidase [Sphingomicrobium nitratireducens]|uniref:Do family serine endopeptidase n=1 Tax=Sphingomicrobium nitratireducens TaxID=2964666 RepID=UPI00223F996A|nr:Do family serine endopeptidase [Sphingomicrobium nitratireducens]
MLREYSTVRYAYGVAAALFLGGAAYSMTTGTALGQVAQNEPVSAVPRPGAPESFADLAARLQPAVVNISTTQRVPVRNQMDPFEQFFRRFGAPQRQQQPEGEEGEGPTREAGSLGSGFIISPDGYIVTNNHLIEGQGGRGTVDEVIVTLTDRTEYQARIIGRDPASDLALLKIEGSNLPYVNWGDSDRVRVGDWIIAIGNPYGLGSTVTAGIVSAMQRNITGVGAYDRYIQTDASINRGNSGGPMFDMAGNVVGINSALISPTGASVGIGLAIPADAARPVIEALKRGERPQRGYLGVGLQPLDEDIADGLGLPKDKGEIVRTVVEGEAAAKSGIQQGDVILSINGREVNPQQTVSYLIANTAVGSTVPVEVYRDGKRQIVRVTVGERPTEEELARQSGEDDGLPMEDENATEADRQLGMVLQPVDDSVRRALRLPSDLQGVVVAGVEPGSAAGEKGLRRGDVILSVNRQRVTTVEGVANAVAAARAAGRSSVLMLIKRGNSPEAFVGIELAR